jgi:Ca2+-binding RTX toxin-like protein
VWSVTDFGTKTATKFDLLDENFIARQSHDGTGFTYSGNTVTAGKITATSLFSSRGEPMAVYTGLDVAVTERTKLLGAATSGYAYEQYVLRGNDTIRGSDWDDTLMGSKGSDSFDGGKGMDLLSFKGFGEAVTVNLATGQAITTSGTSKLLNIEDAEGTAFADTLTGNAGDNQFQGYAGNDKINGGAGFDSALYTDATAAVNVNLATGAVTGGSGSDVLTSIERVVGSRFGDVLTGSAADEFFSGGLGNDTIDGGGGTLDMIEYGTATGAVDVNLATGKSSGAAGIDTITHIEGVIGSAFNDKLTGDAGMNMLIGGYGDDVLNGGTGMDIMVGGDGNDTYYVDDQFDLITELGTGIANGGTDTVYTTVSYTLNANVEILRLSSTTNINGTGNALDNGIVGNAGANILNGMAGYDTLTGGAGKDTFVFNTALTRNVDTISDFSAVDDTIQLENAIFTKLTATGALSAANFVANTAGTAMDANDFIVYDSDSGALYYDADGNGAGVAVKFAVLTGHPAITAADFYVI